MGPTWVPRNPQPHPSSAATYPEPAGAHPIVRQANFPADITAGMVSWGNPEGQVTNSNLELAGRVLHRAYMADCFNIHEQKTMACTDNTAGLWWKRKGLETSTSPFLPAHLLRIQTIHQRFHHYVPLHKFVIWVDNRISDRPSNS